MQRVFCGYSNKVMFVNIVYLPVSLTDCCCQLKKTKINFMNVEYD